MQVIDPGLIGIAEHNEKGDSAVGNAGKFAIAGAPTGEGGGVASVATELTASTPPSDVGLGIQ